MTEQDREIVEAEFLFTGWLPQPPPESVSVKGLGRYYLSEADRHSIMAARSRLYPWLSKVIRSEAYTCLQPVAKRAMIRDEFERTDTDAIKRLFSDPAFRGRIKEQREKVRG